MSVGQAGFVFARNWFIPGANTLNIFLRFFHGRGPPTTHHPHKSPSLIRWYFWGVVCKLSEPKKKQNTYHPQFFTRNVDRLFCGCCVDFAIWHGCCLDWISLCCELLPALYIFGACRMLFCKCVCFGPLSIVHAEEIGAINYKPPTAISQISDRCTTYFY